MSDPADPRETGRPRSAGRRAVDQAAQDARLPVATGTAKDEPRDDTPRPDPRKTPPPADAGVTAQMLGEAPRRGLKGGQETLERARATYLNAEYSGAADRRPKKGRVTKTEI
jgi:hypothetical protein